MFPTTRPDTVTAAFYLFMEKKINAKGLLEFSTCIFLDKCICLTNVSVTKHAVRDVEKLHIQTLTFYWRLKTFLKCKFKRASFLVNLLNFTYILLKRNFNETFIILLIYFTRKLKSRHVKPYLLKKNQTRKICTNTICIIYLIFLALCICVCARAHSMCHKECFANTYDLITDCSLSTDPRRNEKSHRIEVMHAHFAYDSAGSTDRATMT